MKAVAPGKLLLTGAYAVLDGAPAIVAAVDRFAVADASRAGGAVAPEVRAAFGAEPAPEVHVRALQDENGRKLGLGSSAAAVVAALGARALVHGEDVRSAAVRARIFREARAAHAAAQSGGSGVDVAASVHGGVLRYALGSDGAPSVRALGLPAGVCLAAFDSGTSARTSDMLARFRRACSRSEVRGLAARLGDLAGDACTAVEAGDGARFVAATRAFGDALAALGRAIDACVVPPAFAELAEAATREAGAFLPSGAGGGDVGVWVGGAPPSPAFTARASALSMRRLPLAVDHGGLRPHNP